MEAYKPGQLILSINPDAEPVDIPEPIVLTRPQPERKCPLVVAKSVSAPAEPAPGKSQSRRKKGEVGKHVNDERNDRTVFIGNVPTSSTQKTIRQLLAGKAQIESMRFRSASFSQANLPKKAAFIQQQFHKSRDSMNCYVVLSDASAIDNVLALNGTVFEGHHLRVDRIRAEVTHDDKRCVFVGNLPFDIAEDDLWEFFQTCSPIESVRCIRDRHANVGKGFAYVQFASQDSVKQALAFHDGLLKGRKIRVFKAGGKQAHPAVMRLEKKARKQSNANQKKADYQGEVAVPLKKKKTDKRKKKC